MAYRALRIARPEPDASGSFALKALLTLALVMAVDRVSLRAEIIYWPLTALDLAKQRGTGINCLRHLQQIGFAARFWSSENGGRCPQGIQVFTNYLDSPAILVCPANVGHQAPTNWSVLDWGEIDYEWIAEANWNNVDAIACQCRIHNNVVRVSGAVDWLPFGYRKGWPAVIASPLDQRATPGSEVRLEARIAPDSLLPVSYQWRREHLYYVTNVTFVADPDDPDGGYWRTNRRASFAITILSGQTNASYVIAEARTNHSDYYSVVVSNSLGAAASHDARLVVDPAVTSEAISGYWQAVNCVNNLKQIALFGRMAASDQDEHWPQSLSAMTNSYGLPVFGWPIVLYCRFDTARTAPADWTGVDFANTSYEVLPADQDSSAPFCRCKVHGFYAQADGQVVWKPHFHGIRLLTNNATELSVTVFAGQTNRLEASTNLVDWTTVGPGTSTKGNFLFYETNRHPQRFYRLRAE